MKHTILGSSNDYQNAERQLRSWKSRGFNCHIEPLQLPSGQIVYEVVED